MGFRRHHVLAVCLWKKPSMAFSTWAIHENAEGFRGCRSPHPAVADSFHSLLVRFLTADAAGRSQAATRGL